jgi:hypothetical protein
MTSEAMQKGAALSIQAVNWALVDCEAGPERFAAVDPASVEVLWERAGAVVPDGRRSKLFAVHGEVCRRLELHRMTQVLIVDETGAARTLFGPEFGTFDPSTVFGSGTT